MNRRRVLFAVPVVLALVAGAVAGTTWARPDRVAVPAAAVPSATDQVRDAAGRTAAAGSSRVALEVDLALGVVDASVTGEGVLDLRSGRGSLDLDLPLGSVSGLLEGGAVYVRVPAIPAKRWVRLDLAEVFPDSQSAIAPLGRLASADPARALALLAQSAGAMRRVGTEPVRGIPTTHSHGTFDLPVEGTVVDLIGRALLPLDVWVDGDGRVRKMTIGADPDGPGPLPASSLTLEMYDFGVAAAVAPPPANQVTDVSGPVKAIGGLFR